MISALLTVALLLLTPGLAEMLRAAIIGQAVCLIGCGAGLVTRERGWVDRTSRLPTIAVLAGSHQTSRTRKCR